MPDLRLCLEALSALSGCRVESTAGPSPITPQDFVNIVALREFYKQRGLQQLEYPSLGTMSLQDPDDEDLYGPPPAITDGASAPPQDSRTSIKINPQEFFHPKYDFDFTAVKDGDKQFFRGAERYVRPCGWNRAALQVIKRYSDGDGWLGTSKDAWPVSYHGHGMDGGLGIILNHGGDPGDQPSFLEVAAAAVTAGDTQGRGVYSTPDVALAERHCKRFRSGVDGKTYQVLLQNRINPKNRIKCQRENVWLVYVPEGHTDIQTRTLVQESIRPYGLLLKVA